MTCCIHAQNCDASADAASSLGTSWLPSWGSDGLGPDSAKPQRKGNRPGTPRPSFVEPLHSRRSASEESDTKKPAQEGRPASRCLASSNHRQIPSLLRDHMRSSTTSCRWALQRPVLAMHLKEIGCKSSTGGNCEWLYIAADSTAEAGMHAGKLQGQRSGRQSLRKLQQRSALHSLNRQQAPQAETGRRATALQPASDALATISLTSTERLTDACNSTAGLLQQPQCGANDSQLCIADAVGSPMQRQTCSALCRDLVTMPS